MALGLTVQQPKNTCKLQFAPATLRTITKSFSGGGVITYGSFLQQPTACIWLDPAPGAFGSGSICSQEPRASAGRFGGGGIFICIATDQSSVGFSGGEALLVPPGSGRNGKCDWVLLPTYLKLDLSHSSSLPENVIDLWL